MSTSKATQNKAKSNAAAARKTTTERAKEVGAKTPADRRAEASAKVKAMQAEAAEGDVIVELDDELYTVHLAEFQDRTQNDYEFQQIMLTGMVAPLLGVLLSQEDHNKLIESVRDPETKRVSADLMEKKFTALTEAAGQGN